MSTSTPTPKKPSLNILNTSDIVHPRFSVLYWGPHFSGKTTAMLTWPGIFMVCWDPNLAAIMSRENIPHVIPDNIMQFKTQIIPAIQNRKLTELVQESKHIKILDDGTEVVTYPFKDYVVESVAMDSYTFWAKEEKKALVSNNSMKMERDHWNSYLGDFTDWTSILTGVTKESPGRENYHYIASVHETFITDDNNLVDIVPSMQGQFQGQMLQYFDTVLCTDTRRTVDNQTKDITTKVEYFCHTVPPDKWRKAGDRVGSGKRWAKLPPKIEGDYPTLAKAWGLTPPSKG